jgi:RNA polymerase sigma-54 factor
VCLYSIELDFGDRVVLKDDESSVGRSLMEMRHRLFAQTEQTMAITPRVIQSIKLLKFSHEELCDYLKEQEERNPLVEIVIPELKCPHVTVAHEIKPRSHRDEISSGMWGGDLKSIENSFASTTSLREHLLQQAELVAEDEMSRLIFRDVVESIEPDGYLRRPIDDIADCIGCSEAAVETVILKVQQFEPTGVGARNLAECLKLQLMELDELDDQMMILLDNLDVLANYDLEALAKLCKVSTKDIVDMIQRIRSLDPRPGKQFDGGVIIPAMPDVNVEVDEDGTTHVELNSAILPRVLVNREYYSEMRKLTSGEDSTRFVSDCLKEANWLARNLDQRAQTLLRVATEIVKRQKDYFLQGVEYIKPMCQAEVAEELGIHRSTVCRAVSGKYMLTNRGLVEMKYFFSNGLSSDNGQNECSTESIRARIRTLIDAEQNGKVLSDDAIMAVLKEEGIAIARRTVAKYREMMKIPTSSIRRRQHRAVKFQEACAA